MLRPIDAYFDTYEGNLKGVLLFLRSYILQFDTHITEAWKYGMPFFCYNGKMCCYLWVEKKSGFPYLGIVEGRNMHHPSLQSEKRSKMKILLIDANLDIPIDLVNDVLTEMVSLYDSI